jgi:chemosensory pili system protein ChpC
MREGFPHYFLGDISWRGIDVPLLSFEEVNGGSRPPKNTEVRIAVLNNVGTDAKKLPFVAILTQGLPRLVKVSEDIIQQAVKSDLPAEHSRIRVDGEDAIIPNLSYLESLAINLV